MKASDFLISFLVSKGITKSFGYIGGAIAHFYDSISKNKKIEMINGINEQGSAFAAEGYARITGNYGIVFATSGPGATNLVTSIGNAYFDSIPLVCITGQVNTYEYKYHLPNRQIGFQETDIVSIVKPITKYAVMVNHVEMLKYEVEKAFFIAKSGRFGPVLIDIPMDIQRSHFDFNHAKSFLNSKEHLQMAQEDTRDTFDIEQVVKMIQSAKRPILLIGGGVRLANATQELKDFLWQYPIPIVHSLMGKDSVSNNYLYNLGLIGAYGNRGANLSLANSDLVIILGSRLDTRQTGTNPKSFAREAKIIHVDRDKHELGTKIKTNIKINLDIKIFLKKLLKQKITIHCKEWQDWTLAIKEKFISDIDIYGNKKQENSLLHTISKVKDSCNVCVDVGQHQMWVAQSFFVFDSTRILFSGGMGAMGFALPCAIGACVANNRLTLVIAGDGGIQMNIQELEVIKRRNLPIKIFILNNKNLGMVRQFQEIYFDKNYTGTIDDYSAPNFKAIANAYGIKSQTISDFKNFNHAIRKVFANNQPELINIELPNTMTNVEPKLIVGKPIEDMYPYLERSAFYANMLIKPLNEH